MSRNFFLQIISAISVVPSKYIHLTRLTLLGIAWYEYIQKAYINEDSPASCRKVLFLIDLESQYGLSMTNQASKLLPYKVILSFFGNHGMVIPDPRERGLSGWGDCELSDILQEVGFFLSRGRSLIRFARLQEKIIPQKRS